MNRQVMPEEKHGDFPAMAQGLCDYTIDATYGFHRTYGDMMILCCTNEAVYITKEQAMAFFGLVDGGVKSIKEKGDE